jgi:putative ABC transport system permease protein
MQKLADDNPDLIQAVTPAVSVSQATVKYLTDSVTTNAAGTNEFADKINNYTVSSGRYIQYIEVQRRQKVCLLGGYVANELFKNEDPVGKEVKVNGDTFTIIGVLTSKQNNVEGSQDDRIIIPYTTAMRLSRNARVSSYSFSAVSKDTSDAAMTKINEFLYSEFPDEDAYRVMNQAEIISTINNIMGTITLVLVGVAAISLLVGGIGIMNIMLVSVTERTREIGLRMAVGARGKDIMRQFLTEAIVLCLAGGAIGIILGCSSSWLVTVLLRWPTETSVGAIVASVIVSASVGIIFGFYPAWKASRLDPIEALRYE